MPKRGCFLKEEESGSGTVTRRWWNGQAWVSTTETLKAIRDSADKGDPYSQFNLGYWLTSGAPCVAKDMNQGVPYLCKSYDQGFNMAKQHFGSRLNRESMGKQYGCELTGRQESYAAESKVYEQKAQAYLRKAEAGDVGAMVKVATLYQSSDYGLPQDFKKAFHWASRAAKKGSTEGMALVGSLYNRGVGVEKSDAEAFRWSLKAAERGDLDSQYFVGLCYYDGQGVKEDLVKSVKWLAKAMDRGHADAKARCSVQNF